VRVSQFLWSYSMVLVVTDGEITIADSNIGEASTSFERRGVRGSSTVSATGPANRPARNWLLTASLLLFGILIVVAIIGFSYQLIEMRADARRFRQQGRSVDIGGYKLNIDCTGQGQPTVVLESGNGAPANFWRRVQPQIAKFTRVCSYDRAGYGWSDSGPMPRTSAQMVKELHALLQDSGDKPPYIFVGHSLGGLNVSLYNHAYPNEIVGMVLAESTDEELRLPACIQKLSDEDVRQREHAQELAPLLYWFGISRFEIRHEIGNAAVPYATQVRLYLRMRPAYVKATTSEVESL